MGDTRSFRAIWVDRPRVVSRKSVWSPRGGRYGAAIVAPVLLWAIVAGIHLARFPTLARRVPPGLRTVLNRIRISPRSDRHRWCSRMTRDCQRPASLVGLSARDADFAPFGRDALQQGAQRGVVNLTSESTAGRQGKHLLLDSLRDLRLREANSP